MSRELVWPNGRAQVQRLGAMLGPVVFKQPGVPAFAPLQVAPWVDEPGAAQLPGNLRRLTRTVRALVHAPALEITLVVEAREPCTVPIALHPTFRLDAGAVRLLLPRHGAGITYPASAGPGVSQLAPNRSFDGLTQVPCADGGSVDLTRFPLAFDTEELLPDLMLWVSHRGRTRAPWNGRHLAPGVEPVQGVFDLGRIAVPPADHPLADRAGMALDPGAPLVLRYRLAAAPTPGPD